MGEDAARRLEPGGHQEGRPIDRVKAQDVLADHVQIGGPEGCKLAALAIGIADRGDVVGQRVEPDIHDVRGLPGTGMPQLKLVRETDRSLQAAATKLITSLRRLRGAMKSGLAS